MENHEQIWAAVCDELKNSNRLQKFQYETWIEPVEKARFGSSALFLWVPNSVAKTAIDDRYKDIIEDAVYTVTKKNFYVTVLLSNENQPPEDQTELVKTVPEIKNVYSTLNPKYTFDTFVVGNSNRFAHAYSLSVAEAPGGKYNPLFIYGGAGLGKTHLCQAIGNYMKTVNKNAKILFVSSEKYTNEFINSLREKRTDVFREKYRNADILIVDDIQFIAGKESTVEEFFHTFNDLYENNKQIVLTSDRPPKEIDNLDERLITRFAMGLPCEITPPDFETRLAILKNKAQLEGVTFSDDIYVYIADNIKSNIREIEGALNKIIAYRELNPNMLNENTIIQVLKDFVNSSEVFTVTYDALKKASCKYFHITLDELMGKGKRKEIVLARQVCMYMASKYVKDSNSTDIGREFKRDHSTVLYSINKIADDYNKKEEFKQMISNIKNIVEKG